MPRCECEYVPSGTPSPTDSYTEGERRIPHPLCQVHDDDPHEFDDDTIRDLYGLALDYDTGEWIDMDLIDPESGRRWRADKTIQAEMKYAADAFIDAMMTAADELDGTYTLLGGRSKVQDHIEKTTGRLVDWLYDLREPRDEDSTLPAE